jgi:type I restriction enzyme S subunit
MTATWTPMPLAAVLQPVTRTVRVDAIAEYNLLGIRLDSGGPFLREKKFGSEISATALAEVKNGDFIYSRLFAWRGAFGIIGPDLDGCFVSNEFPTFVPRDGAIDVGFLNYWLCLRGTRRRVEVDCSGSTPLTRNRYKEEFFLRLEIPLPPLSEQRRIVGKIEQLASKIEEARGLRDQSSQAADVIPSVQTTALFEQLQGYPVVGIGSLGPNGTNPVQTGPFGAQLHKTEFVDSGIPVLNVGNVWPEGLRLDRLDHVTPDKAADLQRYAVQPNDLLFARSGATLGKVCVVPQQCEGWLMTGHLFRVRFDQSCCDPHFAFAALRGARSTRSQVFDQVRGATRPGFNTTLLSNVKLPIPPLPEQHRIVAYLDDLQVKVDQLKTLQAQTAAEVDALLPSILDRAFRGEL